MLSRGAYTTTGDVCKKKIDFPHLNLNAMVPAIIHTHVDTQLCKVGRCIVYH